MAENFKRLQEQFINVFGLSDAFKNDLRKYVEIEILRIDQALTNDRSNEIFIKVLETELNAGKESKDGNKSIIDSKFVIEKELGFRINPKEVSIFEYYQYINNIKQWQKVAK